MNKIFAFFAIALHSHICFGCFATPKIPMDAENFYRLISNTNHPEIVNINAKSRIRYDVYGFFEPSSFIVNYLPKKTNQLEVYKSIQCKLKDIKIWNCETLSKNGILFLNKTTFAEISPSIPTYMANQLAAYFNSASTIDPNSRSKNEALAILNSHDSVLISLNKNELSLSSYIGPCNKKTIKLKVSDCPEQKCKFSMLSITSEASP